MKNTIKYIKQVYSAFIGDNLTLHQFNSIPDFIPDLPFDLYCCFNELTTQYINQEHELMNHDFDFNNISFDVVEFEPSDYILGINFSFNPVTEIINIKSVYIDS